MGFFRLNLILDFVHLTLTNNQCAANTKTFRTKRSLEKFYFFESLLSLGLRIAI